MQLPRPDPPSIIQGQALMPTQASQLTVPSPVSKATCMHRTMWSAVLTGEYGIAVLRCRSEDNLQLV